MGDPMKVAPESVARFTADLEALTGARPERLGVAVSGGPDSLALLLLAHAACPDRVEAATVDHALRAESRDEALYVGEICAGLSCPHAILPVHVADGPGGVQAEARQARYTALVAWARERGLAAVATAHHQDDQAETLLMRLQRGAGLAGLAGIRPVRAQDGIFILRPLLGWTRAELAAVVREAGVEPVDDPSNRDARFDRVRVREFLDSHPDFEPRRLARAAGALAEAEESLEWMVERLWTTQVTRSGDGLHFAHEALPAAMKRRIVARIFAELARGSRLRGEDVGRLISSLEAGETATLAGLKCAGGTLWRFAPAPPRRAVPRPGA